MNKVILRRPKAFDKEPLHVLLSYGSSSEPISGNISRAVPTRDKSEFTRLEYKWSRKKIVKV